MNRLVLLVLALAACSTEPPGTRVPVRVPSREPEGIDSGGTPDPVEVADGRVLDDASPDVVAGVTAVVDAVEAARDHWQRAEPDGSAWTMEVVATADGSFTGRGAAQTAVLYSVGWAPPARPLGGLLVLDDGAVVRNVTVEGGASLRALPDVDGDGRDELAIGGGGTNMGETVRSVLVAELAPGGLDAWGRAFVYHDDCGAAARGAEATRLVVRPGARPTFEAERFEAPGACAGDETWRPAGSREPVRLEPAADASADVPAPR